MVREMLSPDRGTFSKHLRRTHPGERAGLPPASAITHSELKETGPADYFPVVLFSGDICKGTGRVSLGGGNHTRPLLPTQTAFLQTSKGRNAVLGRNMQETPMPRPIRWGGGHSKASRVHVAVCRQPVLYAENVCKEGQAFPNVSPVFSTGTLPFNL